jgi:hypothetical protein
MVRRVLPLGLVLTLSLVSGRALADDDETRARELFFAGHEAADRGDHATACEKFGQSLELFRRVSTLLNLGKCSEELGDITAALAYWTEGAALLEPQDPRMTLAKERIAALETRVPVLSVAIDPVPAGAVLTVDGEPHAPAGVEGLRLPPGAHRLELRAPGREPVTEEVTLAEGEQRRVSLAPGPPLAPPSPLPPPAATVMTPAADEGLSGIQVGGIVVGAVGLGGVVLGAVTGGMVLSRKSTVDDLCADDVCTDQKGIDAAQSGSTLATVSTVGFVAGGAALTAGVLMIVLGEQVAGDDGVAAIPVIGPGRAGLTMVGRW